jgi:ribosomal protein L7/L12
MSNITKTIIAATVQIIDMDKDQLQTHLLEILSSNPSIVLQALGVKSPAKSPAHIIFKVVVDQVGANCKIPLIKMFRQVSGCGLADAKDWVEGAERMGFQSGVLGQNMSRYEADYLANDLNRKAKGGYTIGGYDNTPFPATFKVIPHGEEYQFTALRPVYQAT